MTIDVEAVYEAGILKPKHPLRLTEGSQVRLTVRQSEEIREKPVDDQQGLSSLIGAWKTNQPSDDEEIERILDEEHMRKHG